MGAVWVSTCAYVGIQNLLDPHFSFPVLCAHTGMPQSPSAELASPGQDLWSPFHLGQQCPVGDAPIDPGQHHSVITGAQEPGQASG